MRPPPLALRQLIRSGRQGTIVILCVMLAMVTLVALNGFGESISRQLLRDARSLHAGDIIIRSRQPFPGAIDRAVDRLRQAGRIEAAQVLEFYSMVREPMTGQTLLAHLKAVEAGYPFYGRVELASGRPFSDVLLPGQIIVENGVLDRLRVPIGGSVQIGRAELSVADRVIREPDRPVDIFSIGPRIFVTLEDLPSLDLVKPGSRVRYRYLIKVQPDNAIDRLAAELQSAAGDDRVQVETFRSARSGIKRFLDNLLFFLNLIGIFTLLLAGIGIQNALSAFLAERRKTVAIMKTVGATSRFIIRHYLGVVGLMGVLGTIGGLVLGYLVQRALPGLFEGLIPSAVVPEMTWRGISQGMVLGIFIIGLFAVLPLYRLKEIKPTAIFRKEQTGFGRSIPGYLAALVIVAAFTGMILEQLRDPVFGAYFILAAIALVLVTALIIRLILSLLKRMSFPMLSARQAVRGLFRPGNATLAVMVTLTAALSFLFAIHLIERNLDAAFIQSYPPDAPNLFFIDIQPDQVQAFADHLKTPAEFYPVVRARIQSINGRPIDPSTERRRRGDNLARQFSLTYRSHLLADEKIIRGRRLFGDISTPAPVSVLDTVAEMADIDLGDRIRFRIQGVPLEAQVTSIRTRTRESISPFFYFVFPETVLKKAPHTVFTAIRAETEDISSIRNRTIARFPTVTVVDASETLLTFSRVMARLSRIVRFFSGFSIAAGLLILIGSVIATRFSRTREAVYFKVLGARRRFVLGVFSLENAIIGLVCAVTALAIAQGVSGVICSEVFKIAYTPFIGTSLLLVPATTILVVAVGLLSAVSILRRKPAPFLREQTRE